MLLFWLLLCCSSQKLKADDETIELEFKKHSDGWVCGSETEKKFIISVNVGEIKYEDEFLAVQVYFTYNPNKLLFLNLLDKNTLSEFFEIKGSNVLDSGLYTAYATTMTMNRVTGNKPLMAFEVKYLGDCPDTAHINFDDIELDISQNFLDKLNYKNKSVIIDFKTKETANSFIEVSISQDTLKDFDEDSLAIANIKLNTNGLARVDSLDFEISFKKSENIQLIDIEAIDSTGLKFVIDSLYTVDDTDTIRIKIHSRIFEEILDESIMKLKFKRLNKVDDTIRVDMNVIRINDCSCATSFKGDKLFVVSEKDTSTEVVSNEFENENKNIYGYYNYISDEFVIKTSLGRFKKIVLYDIMGKLIEDRENTGNNDEIRITGDKYENGIYLVNIKLLNGIEKNIVLIKN
ncbi:MAG: hypothetical protein V1779_10380 [bacterium]